MNFTRDQLVVLGEGFGLIARAAKKIRTVLVAAAANESAPTPSTPPTPPSESEVESVGEPVKDDSILKEDFGKSALEFMYSKDMVWSELGASAYFRNMVRRRMRANRLKYCWVHTCGTLESRQNWTKISVRTAEEIFKKIRCGWEEILDEIREHYEKPKDIRASKWRRRDQVLLCVFPKSLFQKKGGFKQILLDIHDDLPSFK